MTARAAATLARLELAALVAFHLALIFIAVLAMVGFAAVGVQAGNIDPGPEPTVLTPVGMFLVGTVIAAPAAFLLLSGLALHRFVVRPLVRDFERQDRA